MQAVDPAARIGKLTGMLLEQDVDQIVPLFFFPEMVRDLAARSSPAVACTLAHLRGVAWCCPPQLLAKIKEAEWVLDLAHSAGGEDKSNSPDPNPGAESAAGSKARRAHACA